MRLTGLFALGCILRYIISIMHNSPLRTFQGFGQGGIFDAFLVGHMRDNLSLQEDIFRASNQIQTIGVVQKPLIQFLCKASAGINALRSSKLGIDISINQLHLLMGTVATAMTACLYRTREHTDNESWIWMIWLNPILIMSACISPIPSIELLLLLFVSSSPPTGAAIHSLMTVPAFGMLLLVDQTYIVLLPAICVRSFVSVFYPEAPGNTKQLVSSPVATNAATAYLPSLLHVGGGLLSLLVAYFYFAHSDARFMHFNTDITERCVPVFAQTQADATSMSSEIMRCFSWLISTAISSKRDSFSDGSAYLPSLGIFWYMDAQVFSEFRTYVSVLIRAQPYLIALPIFQRFGYKRNKECLHILAAVVLLFKPALCLSDVSIAIVMLSTNVKVISTMRRIPFTCLCILLSACLSLLTVQLWLQQGTGNANFLFFQGLVLWVACAVGVVEFIRAVVVGLD